MISTRSGLFPFRFCIREVSVYRKLPFVFGLYSSGYYVLEGTGLALERGRYDPGLPLAFSIARLFSVSIEEIFQPDGD
tara:strand:- start:82 stop:315 length:234 start_codon:yes stop_codon:yes gene_type:complete